MTELLLTGASGFIGSNVRTQMPDSIRVTPLSVRNDDWRNADFSKFDAALHAAGIAARARRQRDGRSISRGELRSHA